MRHLPLVALLSAIIGVGALLPSNPSPAEAVERVTDASGNYWDEHEQAWADGKGHWWRWGHWRNADDSLYRLADGLGHFWYWGAWRNADGSLWSPAPSLALVFSTSGCPALIASSLGHAGCMVSFCESGWNQWATGSAGERGWFQLHPRWHADATYDPAGNVAAAIRISRGGTDWSQWTTRGVLWSGVCPSGVPYPG